MIYIVPPACRLQAAGCRCFICPSPCLRMLARDRHRCKTPIQIASWAPRRGIAFLAPHRIASLLGSVSALRWIGGRYGRCLGPIWAVDPLTRRWCAIFPRRVGGSGTWWHAAEGDGVSASIEKADPGMDLVASSDFCHGGDGSLLLPAPPGPGCHARAGILCFQIYVSCLLGQS